MKPLVAVPVALLLAVAVHAETPSPFIALSPPPPLVGSAELSQRTPVFVYYVNDLMDAPYSVYQKNVSRLLRALEVAEKDDNYSFFKGLQEFIQNDFARLNTETDKNAVILREAFCERKSLGGGLAIFRNAGNPVLAVGTRRASGSWEYCKPELDIGGTVRKTWDLYGVAPIVIGQPILQVQPLAHMAIFRSAIDNLLAIFPKEKHRFIIYLRGHGDSEHFLTPRYPFDLEKISSEQVRAYFLKNRALFEDNGKIRSTPDVVNSFHQVLAELAPRVLNKDDEFTKESILEFLAQQGGGDPLKGLFVSLFMADTSFGSLESSRGLRELIASNDYSKLNIRNIGRYVHFGIRSSQSGLPFQDIIDSLVAPRELEARLLFALEKMRKGESL